MVERSKGASHGPIFIWRPVGVLMGVPDAPAMDEALAMTASVRRFMPARRRIELYRTETANYRDNLLSETPLLWIILCPAEADPPYELVIGDSRSRRR